MCYGLIIPTYACTDLGHPMECEFAWRQCNDMASKMNVDELCEDRDKENPVVLDVCDLPPEHFNWSDEECILCRYMKTDGTTGALDERFWKEASQFLSLEDKMKDALADYQMYEAAGRGEKAKVKYTQWKDLKTLLAEKEAVCKKIDDEYEEAGTARVNERTTMMVEGFREYAAEATSGHLIYFGPISKLEMDRNPPETLPSDEVLDSLPRSLYRTGSGGWLHPDGVKRLPCRLPSIAPGSSRSSIHASEHDTGPQSQVQG